MRTLVDIPAEHLEALNALGEQQQQSRAALIREAVAEYLVRHHRQDAEAAFGLWNGSAGDGLAYQEKVREEW
jgi:predicted transcriptional regulator